MLGMGWQEIFLVVVVAVIVVGPKELPRVLRTVSYWIRKLRGMAREFQSGVEDVIRETDLQDLRKELEETSVSDLRQSWSDATDLKNEVDGTMGVFENTIHAPEVEETMRGMATKIPEITSATDATDATETPVYEEIQNLDLDDTKSELPLSEIDDEADKTPKRTSELA